MNEEEENQERINRFVSAGKRVKDIQERLAQGYWKKRKKEERKIKSKTENMTRMRLDR